MPCVLCGTTDNLTDEHLFPAFTGADLVVKDGTCRRCNTECSKFEDNVAKQTETARHVFEIPNRYGRIPSTAVRVGIAGAELSPMEVVAKRTPDGEIQLHDFVVNVKTEDGKRVREGFFVSKESAERFIERSLARGEKVTELDVPKEITLMSSSQQTLGFAFSPDIRKMVAKIALLSVAYQYGTEYSGLPQFAHLREAIVGNVGADDFPLRIFTNADFISDHRRTPRQHSVRVYLSAGMQKGWALVTLFGGLSYVVELTREFTERDSRKFSLFYDTESQSCFNPIVLYDEQEIIGRVLSPVTVFEKTEAIDAQWYPIVDDYCKQNKLDLSRIVPEGTASTQMREREAMRMPPPSNLS